MKYTQEEIIRYVKENNVKSIRLAFCDIYGKEKNISIMPDELSTAFKYGVSINAAPIENFGEGIFTDLLLHPEPETFSPMPWRPENDKAVRIFCSMTYPDGRPFEKRGTKSILIRALSEAEQAGYEFFFGTELEFYLFKADENGKSTMIPYDEAGFYDIAPDDKCESIRREICLALEEMGITPKNAYHDEGPGQNKVEFSYNDALTAANNVITLKSIIKSAAAKHGLVADFSPKPLPNGAGNGLHINFSIRADDGTDDCMPPAVAGLLNRIEDMTAFLNPTEESYKRLASERAPKYISWSSENHSQLLRIYDRVGRYRRAELRSPDSMANPYLTFALMIFAGLEGIKNSSELPPASNFDMQSASEHELQQFKTLPRDFTAASEIAKSSEFIRSQLSDDIINMYLKK